MTRKSVICYKRYKEIRKEWYFFLVVLLLFIPLIFFSVFYIKPRIEKVFVVKFSENFIIHEFDISAFNYSDGLNYEKSISEDNYSESYFIDKISFGFHNWKEQYLASEYLNAIVYHNYSTDLLASNIESGNYVIREFELENETLESLKMTMIRFKIPHVYQLFYINIHIRGILSINCSFETNFYIFFDTVYDERVSQTNLFINSFHFYATYLNNPTPSFYPYMILVSIDINYDSPLSFDLSFR